MSSTARALPHLEALLRGQTAYVGFIAPLFSAGAAALRTRGPVSVAVLGAAKTYSATIGLDDALLGREPGRSFFHGRSYSPLARLESAATVEACSGIIDDFIYDRLAAHKPLAQHIARVVGELHDNVASHARGVGFSAAQVFEGQLELAVVDAGCGMLANARRAKSTITTHAEAIAWCLTRGNTSADSIDAMAQFLPEDSIGSPFPPSVTTVGQPYANHHLGEGLWRLQELVRAVGGSLFLWSGDARVWIDREATTTTQGPAWDGLVVEMTLPVAGGGGETGQWNEELEALATRLGI
ncbi:MAG: hypothetical protein HYS27_18265 [Deltaproteobacteria bacterium]|nr:hypothetical protein [Deltaproteobacteria bacterium]